MSDQVKIGVIDETASGTAFLLRKYCAELEQQLTERADALRVIAWIRDPARRRANIAFTEGPERQIAYAIEDVFIARITK